jgi:hypothetical protein
MRTMSAFIVWIDIDRFWGELEKYLDDGYRLLSYSTCYTPEGVLHSAIVQKDLEV